MTKPTKNDFYELQVAIEGRDRAGLPLGPGAYFYWFLAHHVKAENVRFAEVFVDEEKTEYDARFGMVFLVTDTGFLFVEYSAAAEEESGDPSRHFGTVTVTVHSRTAAPVESIRWIGRDLQVKKDRYGDGSLPVRLEKGTIAVQGRGWNVKLPARSLDGADEYFGRLHAAVGLA